MRLSEALDLFNADYIALRGLSESTQENYALAVLSFTRAVGDKAVRTITPQDFLTWRRWMEKRNKPGTVRCHMSKLKNLLIFTNKKGFTSFDIDEIYLPKLPPPLPEYLNPEDINKIISVGGVREKAIISLMFTSGIRAGELSRLNKTDIAGNTLYIRQGKCNTSRTVFMSPTTQTYLDAYLKTRQDASPILFYSYRKQRLCTGSINHLIKKLAKEAGVGTVHSHMLRHSFATTLVKNGTDISYVQRMMGHAFVNTTQIYVHLTNQDLQGAHAKVFH